MCQRLISALNGRPTDRLSLAPDPHWGYTKLFCGVCARKVLLAHRGREGGDGALLDFAQAKEAGNAAAKKGDWASALGHYVRSLTLLGGVSVDDVRTVEERGAVHANASLACLKLARVEEALAHADAAVETRPAWAKARGRRAEALSAMGRAEDAEAEASEARKLDATLKVRLVGSQKKS